ncbi:hypothetical protein [Anaerostipes caccae]|uniref:hypothetical protein n=1 Tax=Anaerostipes caccae TaxID=105841 RepID=UPI0038D4254A
MDPILIWDYSQGEIIEFIQGYRERADFHNKNLAMIAYGQVMALNHSMSGKVGDIYDYFPFWSDQEITEAKVEKIKRQMVQVAETWNAGRKEEE